MSAIPKRPTGNRRHFIAALTAAVGSAALPPEVLGRLTAENGLAELLAVFSAHPPLSHLAAKAARRRDTEEPCGVFAWPDLDDLRDGYSMEQVTAELAGRVRDDFRARRIVSIDGWRLSVTEAAALAIVHDESRAFGS